MEEEKKEHESKMKKMEAEMEQVFEMKVKEKKQKLKDSELELTRRHEERKKVWTCLKLSCFLLSRIFFNLQALELQIRELEERRKAFEQEKGDWEHQNGVTIDELKRRSLEANSKEWVFDFKPLSITLRTNNQKYRGNYSVIPWIWFLRKLFILWFDFFEFHFKSVQNKISFRISSPYDKKNLSSKVNINSRTGSLASRNSDDSKKSRVFGSLLRRHTSFGAPDVKLSTPINSTTQISAPIIIPSDDQHK